MNSIINLRERFGRRFRITMEEAYYTEYGSSARIDDPHYQIIPGARGDIFAWDGKRLAASTHAQGSTATRLKKLPFVEIQQDGSDGCTVLFAAEHLGQVAELLQSRRRRRLNEQEKKRLAEIGRAHRFQPDPKYVVRDGVQVSSEAHSRVPGCVGDREALGP